ncbi:STM4014 family protein [Streptomyces sp. NPDC057702]|uniref:STM4014 family protein n=1 Tax=unclassified Streptomyces TaxID=2593676 RepID=UPI0036A5700C
MRFAVVGVRDSRRAALFADAAGAAGLAPPRVLDWADVLRAGAAFEPGETVRVDSPGEDAATERALRGVDDPTRVEGTARWYARFTSAVTEVAGAARAAGADLLDDPHELAVLFDKRRCHGLLHAAGVPVPPSPTSISPAALPRVWPDPADAPPPPGVPAPRTTASGPAPSPPARLVVGGAPVRGWEDVRALLAGPGGLRRAFVKLAHGSSASGVLAVELAGPGRVSARTSVERAPDGRLFNSLRVRRYATEAEVAALVDALAPDGLHVERWLPKAAQRGRAADLRIVVVNGRATHAVVRTSRSPMTNLHLGGVRGDLAAARAATEANGASWAEVLGLAERAARCFPRTLCVGVDVLPGTGWRRFAVGEVNAFGDLLPRLTGLPGSGFEGLDTYGAQIAAVLNKEDHRHATR